MEDLFYCNSYPGQYGTPIFFALLSCHMQNFVVIISLEFVWNKKCISIILALLRQKWLVIQAPGQRTADIIKLMETCLLTGKTLTHTHAWSQAEVNTLTPRQNGCHFPGNIFKMHFLERKMREFPLKLHWSLFLKVQLSIFQHWFR